MTVRLRSAHLGRLAATLAVAALSVAGPGAVASAQPASDASLTLKLNVLNNNSGLMQLQAPFYCPCDDVDAAVYNGDTRMEQPILDGTERAELSYDFIYLDNLKRGATYNLSVKYFDKATGELIGASNTVTFSTTPSTDTEPPTAPTNVHFFEYPPPNFPDYYGVAWTASKDNVDSGSDIQYVIKRNGQVTGVNTEAHKGDVFTVTAIDSSNNFSEPATVTFDGTISN